MGKGKRRICDPPAIYLWMDGCIGLDWAGDVWWVVGGGVAKLCIYLRTLFLYNLHKPKKTERKGK